METDDWGIAGLVMYALNSMLSLIQHRSAFIGG